MAKTSHPIMALILLFHVLVTVAVAGGDIPDTNSKTHDTFKQSEFVMKHDRGYLIPGVGRGIKPKFKDGFNPFTYNPVTGDNDGGIIGKHRLTMFKGVGGGSHVPGGDDTFAPNPSSEVPNPKATSTTTPGSIHN
ncbi:hypothetical protein R6Q57_013735 [Mikania cordata]